MNTKQKIPQTVSRMESVEMKCQEKCEGMVNQYPLSSVLVFFGVGLGIGVALGNLLGEAITPHLSFGQRTEVAAEKLGRQILNAIAGVVPESVSKHISS